MNLPKEIITVTTVSKSLAMFLFIAVPFVGFLVGLKYQQQFTEYIESRASVDQYILKTQPTATQSASTASLTPNGDRANWKTYTITPDSSLGYASYQIKLPADWKQIEHSSNFQGTETFQDAQNIYKLVIEEQKNYNNQTGKPFTNFRELTDLPYDVAMLSVDEQQAARPLPRAGSEHIYEALFFSKDTKLVYSITLETPHDGSRISEGNVLFDQILSTFKFTNQ